MPEPRRARDRDADGRRRIARQVIEDHAVADQVEAALERGRDGRALLGVRRQRPLAGGVGGGQRRHLLERDREPVGGGLVARIVVVGGRGGGGRLCGGGGGR